MIRLGYAIRIQRKLNSVTRHSVICQYRYNSESVSGWCKSTLTLNSSSELEKELRRLNMCNAWTASVSSSEQMQQSDRGNQYKERPRRAGVIWKWEVDLVFTRKSLFDWCIKYQHLKEQHIEEVMVLPVYSGGWQERLRLLWRRAFWIWGNKPARVELKYWMT